MPYITKERRAQMHRMVPLTMGELAYRLTTDVLEWIDEVNDPNYSRYAEAIGVLECVKQELYRRRISPHEDKKIKENGDVF